MTGSMPRPITCTCCSRRGVRKMIRLNPDKPIYVAVCPTCDAQGVAGDLGVPDVGEEES